MATDKILISILLFLTGTNLFCQGVEEQRKYSVPDEKGLNAFITGSQSIAGFSTLHHSDLVYLDIYLDTPDHLLLNNQLSLRFRKRILAEDSVSYGMQLKSEMADVHGIRMEVEETEIDFYKLHTSSGWIPLTDALDLLFTQLEENRFDPNSDETKDAIMLIRSWIDFKSGSSITPFQKLLSLHIQALTPEKISQLTPVLCGIEKRVRSHIYIDTISALHTSVGNNRIAVSVTPDFFIANPSCNWIMESSLDSAVFYPLFDAAKPAVHIYEYEVENKYFIPETGTQLMTDYEIALKNKYRLEIHADSKYKSSMEQFLSE